MSDRPKRIQRKRSKGWRLPEGAVCVTRPGKWGNPFRVGRYYIMGDPDPAGCGVMRMLYCEALVKDGRATLIETVGQSVEWFRRLELLRRRDLTPLRGLDLACWCGLCARHQDGLPLGETCPDCKPCHATVLLELANR